MPTHGDIITFSDPAFVGMGLLRPGVRYRIGPARRRGDLRFTNVETGGSVDWFGWSMRHAVWTLCA
jgi:hypothetical protein